MLQKTAGASYKLVVVKNRRVVFFTILNNIERKFIVIINEYNIFIRNKNMNIIFFLIWVMYDIKILVRCEIGMGRESFNYEKQNNFGLGHRPM